MSISWFGEKSGVEFAHFDVHQKVQEWYLMSRNFTCKFDGGVHSIHMMYEFQKGF